MAYLNILVAPFAAVPGSSRATRSSACKAPVGSGGARFPSGGKGPRRTGAGGTHFLLASAVLGLAQGLHRRGLIGAWGFRLALTLAERLSARGIAKWRAARHPRLANDQDEG